MACKENKTLLESSVVELNKMMNQLEDRLDNDNNLHHNEHEELDDLLAVARRKKNSVLEEVGNIEQRNERRKYQPRATMPLFTGSPLDYSKWAMDMDRMLELVDPRDQLNMYKKSISGDNRLQILRYLGPTRSYEEAKRLMDMRYGNLNNTIQNEIRKLKDLPTPGDRDYLREETNVIDILQFLSWLVENDKTDVFNQLMQDDLAEKLRFTNREVYDRTEILSLDSFIKFLRRVQDRNFRHTVHKTVPVGGDRGEGRQHTGPGQGYGHGGSGGGGGQGRSRTRSDHIITRQTNIKPGITCYLCKNPHLIRNCPERRGNFSNQEWKDFLVKRKQCFSCWEIEEITQNTFVQQIIRMVLVLCVSVAADCQDMCVVAGVITT